MARSIILLLFTTFQATLLGKHAKMEATALSCSGYEARVYLSNSGNASAILTSASLQASQASNKGPQTSAGYNRMDGSSDPQTIQPDAGHVIALSLADDDRSTFFRNITPTDPSCSVQAAFTMIVDAKATTKWIPAIGSCRCPDFVKS